jgi:membrane fusion protein (multidrug efflux system)
MSHTMKTLRATLACAALAAAACSKPPAAPAGPPPAPVRTVTPTVADVPVHRDYPGITMSVRTVDVIPRVAGWIDAQGFANGQDVTDGQMLYVIDPRPYEVAVEKAKADVAIVQAELRNASDMVARNRPLVEVSAISQQEFDRLIANERVATANLAAKRALLDQANLDLSFTRVASPADGQASATNIYPGTYVTPQQVLVTVRQMDPMWVEFQPVDMDIPALRRMLKDGDASTVATLPGGGWSRNGKVVFLDNTVNRDTATIRTRLEVPNADRLMAPGAYVNVRLEVDRLEGAVTVPEQAIVYQTAAATLWTVDGEGKARQKVVKTGPRGGAGIVITEGIGAADQVVVEGMQKLYDGAQTVSPEAMRAAVEAQMQERMDKAAR